MSQTNTKTNNLKKAILGVALLAILVAAVLIIYFVAKPGTTAGSKHLTIKVVDDQGASADYEVRTDAEYLRQAMEETPGLTFEGVESEYGLVVQTVNDIFADYNTNGAYWAFYVNDEYCQYGIDSQPVNDGEAYSIVYTPAE